MEAGSSSPFASKKPIRSLRSSTAKKASDSKASDEDLLGTAVKTAAPPRSVARRRAALSVSDVKKEALRLQETTFEPSAARLNMGSTEEIWKKMMKKKSAVSKVPLPEKYELLEKFFNSLDSSMRLSELRRKLTTFTEISAPIERLTQRSFTYSHLAQLRFIMPEVIVVEKIYQLDELTSSMKPELYIRMNAKAIETENLQLRKIFRDRLLGYINSHPEGDEVPEAELPKPFGRSEAIERRSPVEHDDTASSLTESPASVLTQKPAMLLPSSFKRRFSRESSSNKDETPVKVLSSLKPSDPSSGDPVPCQLSTPVECCSKFMTSTPAAGQTKRSCTSPDGDSSLLPNKLTRRPPPKRLIFDTPEKNKKGESGRGKTASSSHDETLDILSESLIESIREKERLALIAKDPDISRAKWRCKMIAALPKLFNMILCLFPSIRRSVINKEEFIAKIISSHRDIVDRKEVEEQLRLLQELASEWIYEKMASSGELLVCIYKIPSPESIRTRLSEALDEVKTKHSILYNAALLG